MSSQLYNKVSDLAKDDATIYSYLKMQAQTGESDIDTAIKLIRALAQEKLAYLKYANDTAAMSIIPVQPLGRLPR